MCLERIREALLHHRWQEAAEFMACYPQLLEDFVALSAQENKEVGLVVSVTVFLSCAITKWKKSRHCSSPKCNVLARPNVKFRATYFYSFYILDVNTFFGDFHPSLFGRSALRSFTITPTRLWGTTTTYMNE